MIYDCIIIGGGAAGLMCAATMPNQIRGLILEKTPRAGTKLLMSGSGQCNITHAGSIKDFTPAYGAAGKKIRSCLYKYSNLELMDFLEDGGVPLVTREDGKVFPQSMDAHDVLYFFMHCAKKNGFDLATDYHRYTPISMEQVEWFTNAIQYWDHNVFCEKASI